jgi:hypothetical protein
MIGLVSGLVASAFTDRLYSEGIYWMFAMSIAINRIVLTRHAESDVHVESAANAA